MLLVSTSISHFQNHYNDKEPGITEILINSSFLLVLNLINSVLNRTLYCGLVGQVLIGVAWGTPGGTWLSPELEDAVVHLGYLGLIMIVFEGGLSTTISTMKANLFLSVCVALTGIAAPMALSFFLAPLAGASHIQCFAAGAALCSTSLGTTFTVLGTSGLASTRLGCILSTAAMMDDVVGFVMVQIISSLGGGNTEISPVTVIRPVIVSVAFATLLPLAVGFILRPLRARLDEWRVKHAKSKVAKLLMTKRDVFIMQTAMLPGLLVAASHAGASVLLAAYLAGVLGTWWDDKNAAGNQTNSPDSILNEPVNTTSSNNTPVPAETPEQQDQASSLDAYNHYYAETVERVLEPFFFASIGFSVPISKMFAGPVVWRGMVYTILMMIGKALCGLWMVKSSFPFSNKVKIAFSSLSSRTRIILRRLRPSKLVHQYRKKMPEQPGSRIQKAPPQTPAEVAPAASLPEGKRPERPLSLYPAGIMSFAMIARGEIGFLISSVAESNDIFRDSSSPESSDEASEIFLVVTWAIVLCTIVGPLCVGLLFRRVKKLEAKRVASQGGDKKDVFSVWGVP
ncbi:sodium/hydrogen exchanger family protein [Xylariales sp. AK1849]|nr:sodium/hydrogen exchanger family protein [Xylariales sp. AK1849]